MALKRGMNIMRNIQLFFSWATAHIDISFIFTPIALKNTIPPRKNNALFIGYADIFVFGIRIARIQKTTPWRAT